MRLSEPCQFGVEPAHLIGRGIFIQLAEVSFHNWDNFFINQMMVHFLFTTLIGDLEFLKIDANKTN